MSETPTLDALQELNPAFARSIRMFCALYDAAEALDILKPPHGETASEYLREVALHIGRETGAGEDFVQAMVAARPSMFPPGEPGSAGPRP
jgi:hypothetical protein